MVFGGAASKAEQLISAVRDMLEETGLPFLIENVMGASTHMRTSASIVLRGQDFGLATERPRIIESGGGLELRQSQCLADGGRGPAAGQELPWESRAIRQAGRLREADARPVLHRKSLCGDGRRAAP